MNEPDWTRPPAQLPAGYQVKVRPHGRVVQLIAICFALALILGIVIANLV